MEQVNHPKHYADCAITIEPMELTGRVNSALGQALQYVMRRNLKENELQDIKKAIFWLEWLEQVFPTKKQNKKVYIGTFKKDKKFIKELIRLYKNRSKDEVVRELLTLLFMEEKAYISRLSLSNALTFLDDYANELENL